MSYLLITGLFIVSLSVQGSVLALASPGGVHPDFLLLLVVALALLSDVRRGAVLGLAAGLLQDIMFSAPLGFFGIGKMLIGALAGMMSREIYKDFLPAPVLIVTVLTLVHEILTFLLMSLHFPVGISFLSYLSDVSLPRLAMHFMFMIIFYPFLYRLQLRHLLFADTEK